MAPKKKLGQILIKLVSQAQTGFFYVVSAWKFVVPGVPSRSMLHAALVSSLTLLPRPAAPPPPNPKQPQTKKNPRNVPYKLQRVKYDPVVNKHVLFTEAKLK